MSRAPDQTAGCPYADADAAYILGALDPAEQQDFRAHLPTCAHCRAAVAELAVMPGLLARLLPENDAALDTPAPLLPDLMRRAQVERRFARWRARCTGFLAAAVLGVGAALIAVPGTQDPDRVLTMAAAPGVPVEATLQVTGRGWGTSIDTTCRYDGEDASDSADGGPTYELWAITDTGREVLVSSWHQLTGRELTVPGSTRLELGDILRFEVRTGSGSTILSSRL